MTKFLCIVAALIAVFSAGCTTAPVAVTTTQQTIANATEDVISIGLVPVLAKNPSYVAAAKTVALGLGTFSGLTLTQQDISAFIEKIPLSAQDQQTAVAVVTSAWQVFQKRYAEQVGASTRPDVKLFLGAVSNGILNAVAAVPPASASNPPQA